MGSVTEPQMPPPYPQQGPYGYPQQAAPGYGYPVQAAPGYGFPQQPAPGYGHPYGVGPYPYRGQFPPAGPPVAGPPPAMLASQGARLAARLIDIVILVFAMIVLAGVTSALQGAVGMENPVAVVVGLMGYGALFACLFGYEPFMIRRYGSTLGKLMCNVRVARLSDARHLSVGQALGRYFITVPMLFVPFLGTLNVLWCCWDSPNRQCLHDKAVSSVVVKRQL